MNVSLNKPNILMHQKSLSKIMNNIFGVTNILAELTKYFFDIPTPTVQSVR